MTSDQGDSCSATNTNHTTREDAGVLKYVVHLYYCNYY